MEWSWESPWATGCHAHRQIKAWQSIWEGLPGATDGDFSAVGTQARCWALLFGFGMFFPRKAQTWVAGSS